MSNFNTAISTQDLNAVLGETKQTQEDRYVRDRSLYVQGRANEPVPGLRGRDLDMYNMGNSAYRHLGEPS